MYYKYYHTHTHTHPLTLTSADMPLSVSFKELHGNWPVTLYMLRVRLKQEEHTKKHNSNPPPRWCIHTIQDSRASCVKYTAFILCIQDVGTFLNMP